MTPLFDTVAEVYEIDLPRIEQLDVDAAAYIAVVLEELGDDPDLVEDALRFGHGQGQGDRHRELFGAMAVAKYNPRRAIWRLKLWKLENRPACWDEPRFQYRVIYGYFRRGTQRSVWVLAAYDKAWNYAAASHPYTVRVFDSYDALFPDWGE